VTDDGARPTITITNTGPVIPAGQVTRLLEPFQRLPDGRRADQEGLGLGLPIVAAIAKAHNATLAITPGRPGGLTIEISFPATAAATTPPGMERSPLPDINHQPAINWLLTRLQDASGSKRRFAASA